MEIFRPITVKEIVLVDPKGTFAVDLAKLRVKIEKFQSQRGIFRVNIQMIMNKNKKENLRCKS